MPDFNHSWNVTTNFSKTTHIRFHENLFRSFSNCCVKIYGKADMEKIIGTSGNFRNPITKTIPCGVTKIPRPAVGLRVNRLLKGQTWPRYCSTFHE
jgi:hypothetical protein